MFAWGCCPYERSIGVSVYCIVPSENPTSRIVRIADMAVIRMRRWSRDQYQFALFTQLCLRDFLQCFSDPSILVIAMYCEVGKVAGIMEVRD